MTPLKGDAKAEARASEAAPERSGPASLGARILVSPSATPTCCEVGGGAGYVLIFVSQPYLVL